LQFDDDGTPAHLTGGATNLYKHMDITLKAEEWRQPGLVALAAKVATSAAEHRPIRVRVPSSYYRSVANISPAERDATCVGSHEIPEQVVDSAAAVAAAAAEEVARVKPEEQAARVKPEEQADALEREELEAIERALAAREARAKEKELRDEQHTLTRHAPCRRKTAAETSAARGVETSVQEVMVFVPPEPADAIELTSLPKAMPVPPPPTWSAETSVQPATTNNESETERPSDIEAQSMPEATSVNLNFDSAERRLRPRASRARQRSKDAVSDAPGMPPAAADAGCASFARFSNCGRASVGAAAAMRAPPPKPAPPPRPDDEVELASVSTGMAERTSVDLNADSAERLSRTRTSRARRRSADACDEMRLFDTRGTREQPPTHRVSGRVKQMRNQANTASQESEVPVSTQPSIVGRARSDSLADDSSAIFLAARSSAMAREGQTDVDA
jgi:hypothetical protein